jgi:hypothetical protein
MIGGGSPVRQEALDGEVQGGGAVKRAGVRLVSNRVGVRNPILHRSSIPPAKPQIFEVEPRGVEPLTSAVQRRRHALLELSSGCKTAANACIFNMTLILTFQEIYPGCCTVAAHKVFSIVGA